MWVKSPSTTQSSPLWDPSFCISSRDKKKDLPSLGVFYSSNPQGNPNQVRKRKVLFLNSLLVVKRRNTEFLFFRVWLYTHTFSTRTIPWKASDSLNKITRIFKPGFRKQERAFYSFQLVLQRYFLLLMDDRKKTYISLSLIMRYLR